MQLLKNYHFYASITIICWSLAYVYTRLALQHFSIFSVGFLRYFIASIILLGFVIYKKIKPPKKQDYHLYLASGGSGFFLYMILFNQGLRTVNSATSSIIIATVPIMTAVLSHIFYKEKLKSHQWFAISLEFTGILILTLNGHEFTFNIGIIWLLAASLLLSIYNLLQKHLTKSSSSLQAVAYSILTGTLMLSVFSFHACRELVSAPIEQINYLLILGIFCSTIAYITWTKAFSLTSNTAYVSNYMFITPFLAALLGYFIAGETLELSTVLGGSIILSGLFIFYKPASKQNK